MFEGINWGELFTAMDHFLLSMAVQHGFWVYVTLFAIFFSETGLVFMAFLPGDSLLFIAGAVAASGAMDIWILMPVIFAGAVLGNTVNYAIGSWLGHKVYDGTIRWIDPVALKKTHVFYERHGGKTLILARFTPVVRTFAPLVAGAGSMDIVRFQAFNVVGAALWMLSLVGGGYLFGNVPFIKDNLGLILLIGILAVVGPLFALAGWRIARQWFGRPAPQPLPVKARDPE
ncbi:MAG TPA: VTT domain-containing protein [Burkholderiaceae bacterium]|nr:VTT domain-containing protein [Burkholderiaceae bacterium]